MNDLFNLLGQDSSTPTSHGTTPVVETETSPDSSLVFFDTPAPDVVSVLPDPQPTDSVKAILNVDVPKKPEVVAPSNMEALIATLKQTQHTIEARKDATQHTLDAALAAAETARAELARIADDSKKIQKAIKALAEEEVTA
jgi:hypothetical protein